MSCWSKGRRRCRRERVPDLVDDTGRFPHRHGGARPRHFRPSCDRGGSSRPRSRRSSSASARPASRSTTSTPTSTSTCTRPSRARSLRSAATTACAGCACRSSRAPRCGKPSRVRGAARMRWSRRGRGCSPTRRGGPGCSTPDAVFGLAWSGAMTASRLAGLLRAPAGGRERNLPAPGDARRFPGHARGLPLRR